MTLLLIFRCNSSLSPPFLPRATFTATTHCKTATQATVGPCNIAKPSYWDYVARAKYDAWSQLGSMSKDEAMDKYMDELVAVGLMLCVVGR